MRFRSGTVRWPVVSFMALGLAGLSQTFSTQNPSSVPPPTPAQIAFFETKIRPIFAEQCQSCHGKTTQLGGLRLDTREGVMKGGDSGPALQLGDPDKSLLVLAVLQTGKLKMPQVGKLSAEQVHDIEDWVRMGAPWPANDAPTIDPKRDLWSLKPVAMPTIPKVKLKTWVRNPIDAFVLSGLEAKGLAPAPATDKRTLLRRVSYDLTGLPPTAEQVDAFVADKSTNAYEKQVDRLLNSPQYGERWARHWLDVARYADTKGYVFNEDRNYFNAYTFRDWVIQAINRDLPYDQFIVDQVAADRNPAAQRTDLAALGFLTVGRRFLNSEPDIIDDRIDVTMRGFEGFTVGCARCHDHKFDPIPTQDYYSLYSVFASSDEQSVPISAPAITDPWEKYNQQVSAMQGQIHDGVLAQIKRLRDDQSGLGPDIKQELQSLTPDTFPDERKLGVLAKAFQPEERTRISGLGAQLDRLKSEAPPTPEFAMAMRDDPKPHDGHVFLRGNPNRPGPEAPRRFLLALSKPGIERDLWTRDSGRLELAEAIASKDNPLTARVFVNRAWMFHFGQGIVRTPSDFGHQGQPPTDPKLLDYLAATFMRDGWSMRKLHRLIVTSATYRQSCDVSPKTFNVDPDNRLWGRMNRQRLDLEQMRDSLMLAAGKLDTRDVGGKSVDLWAQPFTGRRAVYGFVERQNLPGIFRTFDFATPDATNPQRFVTTVPQQALFFMNSPLVVDEAQSVAQRPEIESAKDDGQRVRRVYRLLFDRLPDVDETSAALKYLDHRSQSPVESIGSSWQYGYAGYDESLKRTNGFTPFAVFDQAGYHPTSKFPDPTLGYVVINSIGGHPGRDVTHAATRRWTAPADMVLDIKGLVSHRQKEGDGVRARVVSSRDGLLGEWQVHNGEARTDLSRIIVRRGDTLDFMVDPIASDAYDSFSWAPSLQSSDGKEMWDASANFGPPPAAPVTRFTLYVQALLMTNEFLFVD